MLRTYCALSALIFFAGASPACAAEAPQAGVARALLIGVNHYRAVPGLQGSVNDVETMREVLTTRWRFEPRNIRLLIDEEATRANILEALNQLVQTAGPDDTVYVHYSGHGSQVQDLNGDETDGLDETIVPQDGRSGDVPDIVDDELDVIFSKLRARSAVIVLDSCHSGTATRAFDIRTRSVPRDERIGLYRAGVTGATTRGIVPFHQSRFIVMSGAAANEEALDGPVEGRYHGFFTYALSRSFTSAPPTASPREIFGGVVGELGRIQASFGRTSMPEPQLEAPPDALDRPLFAQNRVSGGDVVQTARLAWVDVEPSGGDTVTLVNGVLLGATQGSTWAIYPPGEERFTPGRASAVATVTQASGNDASAKIDPVAAIERKSRAVAMMAAPATSRVAFCILDVPQAQRRRIEDILMSKVSNAVLVGPDQPARFLVDMQGRQVRLLTADGLRVVGSFDIDDESTVADIARLASRTSKASELLALDNPSARLVVTARVVGAERTASRDIRLVADTGPARLHSRRDGEPRSSQNSLQLRIEVSEAAYLTIVDVDAEGSVNVLFPNAYQRRDFLPGGAVRANEEVLLPDSLQSGNRAGFHWDYGPPPGVDTVRVFAATDAATAATIRSRIGSIRPTNSQSRGEAATRSLSSDFELLRGDLTRLATRGIAVVKDESRPAPPDVPAAAPGDWAAASVVVQVDK